MIREPRPPLEPMRDETDLRRLLSAIAQWENRPHNQPGSDKTWIERLLEEDRRFYESAVRVR